MNRVCRPIGKMLLKVMYKPTLKNIENIPKSGPVILAGNHTNNYDCVLMFSCTKRPVRFIAKSELFHGWKKHFLNSYGAIPVHRNRKDANALSSAIEVLKSGGLIGIFPEGTINRTDDIIMPFKFGTVKMALEANAKIVPFSITGKYTKNGKITICFGEAYNLESDDLVLENERLMEKVTNLLLENGVDKNGKRKAQRVATVRATNKILDNRSIADGQVSEDQQTKFYEIKGRKIMPGETLVENTDLGLNIAAEYTISEASIAFEYRFGKYLNVPGLFVYLKAGMPWSKGLGGIKIMAANSDGEWKSFQVYEGSLGFAKEFNFAGTFALTAGIEGGYLIAPGAKDTWYENNQWNYDADKDYNSKSYKVGAHVKLGYYLTRNIQLYANIGYNYYIKSDEFMALQEYWVNSEKSNRHKFQKFEPLALGFGLKVGF